MFRRPFPVSFKRRSLMLASFACLAASLGGCKSSPQVRHQDASDLYHRTYRTYGLLQHPVGTNENVDGAIEDAIHKQMQSKGYMRKDPAEAELLISYRVLLSGDLSPVSPASGNVDELGSYWPPPGSETAWDVVPTSKASGPQAVAESRDQWPDPGPDAVWVAMPEIGPVGRPNPSKQKTLLAMFQEASSYRVVWLGWSQAEVDSRDFQSVTGEAMEEILKRIPVAAN